MFLVLIISRPETSSDEMLRMAMFIKESRKQGWGQKVEGVSLRAVDDDENNGQTMKINKN